MKIQLDSQSIQLIKKILKHQLPKHKVLVFGSRVTKNYKPHSDLDLCILGETPLTLTQLAVLKETFSESDLPIRVDIVDWATLSPEFRNVIKTKSVKLISAL